MIRLPLFEHNLNFPCKSETVTFTHSLMPVISCNLKKTIKNRFKEKFKNADFGCKNEPFSPFCKTFPHTTKPDLDGNQFAQVYYISHHFFLSCLRHVRNFTLNRMFLGMHCKNYIKVHAFENNLLATGCYISSVKIMAEYCKKDFLVLIIFCLFILSVIYSAL